MSLSAFNDELAQVRTKKKEFLEQMDRIIPWEEWVTLIQPCYYKGERGNKPYALELILRLFILQNLYDLSDEGTIFHCPIQIIKRSMGKSAVAAAAYRSGEELVNE